MSDNIASTIPQQAMVAYPTPNGLELYPANANRNPQHATDQLPPLYFQPSRGAYWREDCDGKWIQVNSESARHHVMRMGFSNRRLPGCVSAADECLLRIQERQNIGYAAPLAGYRAGLHEVNGQRILVTRSPNLITPRAGDWPRIRRLIDVLFGVGDTEGKQIYFGWLNSALKTFYREGKDRAQVLILAGPVNCGKSLLIDLQTKMFGGRVALPYKFLTGETHFNAELYQAEHLVIDDNAESTDYAARRRLGAGLKQIAVVETQTCFGKHVTAEALTPRWRMTIALNDDPERMQILPPLDGDLADKVILLRVGQDQLPVRAQEDADLDRAEFWSRITPELPAFIDYILNYRIPEHLEGDGRMPVVSYHDPALMQMLDETKPETSLLGLIDRVVFRANRPHPEDPWEGTAADLLGELQNDPTYGTQARELMKRPNTCGTYLTRLTSGENPRVSSRVLQGDRLYTIQRPHRTGRSGLARRSGEETVRTA